MRTRSRGISRAAVLAAGFVALGVTAVPANAFADVTNGSGGVLSGNQIDVPISAPLDVSGNGAALLGTGRGTSRGGVKVHESGGSGQKTSGAHGIASGNQVNAPISLPVNVCGNGAGVLGRADAGCAGGAKVNGSGKGGQVTDGTGGVLAGNQVNAPISIPVDVCGNAVAVAGDAVAGCEGGSLVKNGGNTGSGQRTSGVFGIGAGNQADVPISVPVDLCGNAVGNGAASCEGGASVRNGGHRTGRQITDGAFGIIAGNQANAPVSAPVTACGDAAGLAGRAWAFCEGGAHARSSSGGDQRTSGAHGIIAGNQGNAPISIPVEVCGDAAAAVGTAAASCNGQTLVEGSHGSGAQTSGAHGVGGGNQSHAPVQAPAEACGNAASVVGVASGLCEGGPGYGGYHPYSRTTGTAPGLPEVATGTPATDGLPELPGVPAATARHTRAGLPSADGVLPENGLPGDVSSTGGLRELLMPVNLQGGLSQTAGRPGLPAAGARRGKKDLPSTKSLVPLSAVSPVQALAKGTVALPKLDGSSPVSDLVRTDGLSQALNLPAANRRAQGGLPGAGGLVSKNALPKIGGVSADGLPGTGAALPKAAVPSVQGVTKGSGGLNELVRVPAVQGVPGVPDDTLSRRNGSPVAVSVLDTRALPDGGVVRKAIGRQALDALHGAAVPGAPVAGEQIVPVTGELGAVRNVASEEVVPDGGRGGSLWALGASGMLGVLAGGLALARRVRLGGRR
ncbi:chaplin family protein [Actinomadura sp.]|uniref:chaplin family protein n=1 Tax=Actinomadura sp. TaxID=1989 RepID=UPI0037C5E08D